MIVSEFVELLKSFPQDARIACYNSTNEMQLITKENISIEDDLEPFVGDGSDTRYEGVCVRIDHDFENDADQTQLTVMSEPSDGTPFRLLPISTRIAYNYCGRLRQSDKAGLVKHFGITVDPNIKDQLARDKQFLRRIYHEGLMTSLDIEMEKIIATYER